MQHNRITILLVAGMILAVSASASALACQSQPTLQERGVLPDLPRVHISVEDTRDQDGAGDVNVRVSPWRVVIDADHEGVVWTSTHRFEIVVEGRAVGQLAFPDGNQGSEETPVIGRLILENLERSWAEDDKASIAGAYSIKIWLKDNETITIDPDHLIDPRRPGGDRP